MFHRLFSRCVSRFQPRAARASVRKSRNGSCVDALALAVLLGWIGGAGMVPAATAEGSDPSAEAMQSLDQQVQQIKSDVLSIAAELGNLEEKLLYPADTQLALFVTLPKAESLELDSARIRLDGQLVAQHVYSWQELQALAKGGVQRIHTANVPTGAHELEVTLSGRRGGDKPFDVVQTHAFEKGVGPQKLGIRLSSSATGAAAVDIEAW